MNRNKNKYMSEYKPSSVNPIFGDKGYHTGDAAEDLPGTAEQKAREEREKARAEQAELDKKAAEEKRQREEEENSYINGDFQTLLGFGANKTRPEKRLVSDTEIPTAPTMAKIKFEAPETGVSQATSSKPESSQSEINIPKNIPESHPMEMTPEELEAQVEQQVDQLPEKTLERQVLTAAPNLNPEQTKQVVEELQKPENKAGIIKRMKGKVGAFVAGGAGGYAGSMVARVFISTGIRSIFGTTLGVGIAAGAIAGGSVEGVKSYLKERNKFSADDIIARLDNSKSEVERAVVISEANKALQEARISHPERVSVLTQKIQEAQVVLEAKIKSPEFKNKSEKDKIAFILKTSETARDNINREQKKEIKALIKEIKFKTEKSEVDWKKVTKSAGKGALVGALGGALGGLASGWIAEHLGHSADDLANIHAGHIDQAYSSAIENGRAGVLNGNYVEHVLAGDKGLTDEARNAIHDYMINLHSLSAEQAPHFTTEQYIYAEDWIVKNALNHSATILHPGDTITVSGTAIQQALEHAQNLSQEQLANLTELISHQPHLISQHTADWLNNFDYANPENGQAVASLLQQAGSSAEYVVNDPGIMEAAAWASGALPEASYQMGREATHFIWHMVGRDADAEPRGISDVEAKKTTLSEKEELPAGTFLADAQEKNSAESSVLPHAEVINIIDTYKDLKIDVPKSLEGPNRASLGLKFLRVLETDPGFSTSSFYAALKRTKFNLGISSARNKEGVVARKTGIYMYIDNSRRLTSERAKALIDSLEEKLTSAVSSKKESPTSSPETLPENTVENLKNLPEIGSTISVTRNDGSKEEDWMVIGIDSATKTITALKPNTGREMVSMDIPFEDYQKQNEPEAGSSSSPAPEAPPAVEAPATPENPQVVEEPNSVDTNPEAVDTNVESAADESNRVFDNPNIKTKPLNSTEALKLDSAKRIVEKMDISWPSGTKDQGRDSFIQDLISIAEQIRVQRNDLLPYFSKIKMELSENRNNVQGAEVKVNANDRYNINILAPQSTIYSELIPVLEDMKKTANPA